LIWQAPPGDWHLLAITEDYLYEGTHASLSLADKLHYINLLMPEPTQRFCELTYGGPDERLFDLDLNGRRVLERFDLYREAGGRGRAPGGGGGRNGHVARGDPARPPGFRRGGTSRGPSPWPRGRGPSPAAGGTESRGGRS
jgi:hypothetical protein